MKLNLTCMIKGTEEEDFVSYSSDRRGIWNEMQHFCHYTMHFEFYLAHSPTNALCINLVKSFKFTLKYTIISLLHVSVFNDHHQEALSVPDWSYIYVKTLGKITSLYKLGDMAAWALYKLGHVAAWHDLIYITPMLPHHLIYIMT